MTRLRDIYQCTICGHVVEVIKKGTPTLSCCGKHMEKLNEKSTELGHEKHLPVVESAQKGIVVRVGETPHPMTVEHHIVWIELLTDLKAYRIDLPLDVEPIAEFSTQGEPVTMVRAYCSVHGLWGKE